MRFIGKVWRLLVGIKDGLVLIMMLLFFGFLYAFLSAAPRVPAGTRAALLLDLSGPIVEQPVAARPVDLISGSQIPHEYRLRDIVHSLETAATDDRVRAVAIDLDIFAGGGQVTLADVGRAIDKVRKANKPVLAFASTYTDDSYQIAAHASEVWLDPMGSVLIRGPGGTNLYYKGLLDKVGVTANVYKVGTYKAATEPFTRNDMSPEARESLQAIANALWDAWQSDVARARPKAQIAPYVADFSARVTASGGDIAKAALDAHLVDKLGDRTEFGNRMAQIVGTDRKDVPGSFKTIKYDVWNRANPAAKSSGNIGIVTIAGEIVDGSADSGTAGGKTIRDQLFKGLHEQDLSALVIRIDSPGGSVMASEQIRRAILDAKAEGLPVVVSMGSVAASGGYWVATAADYIFAEPSTITGSIGVFGIVPSFQGTLGKAGLGADGVKTTPYSGEPDVLRGPSPDAGKLIQASVDNIYRRFLGLVSTARRIPTDRVDSIAQGRVWDGGTAHQLGLVDRFGSMEDAIAEAAKRAKLDPDDVQPVYLEEGPDFLDTILADWASEEEDPDSQDAVSRFAAEPRQLLVRAFADAERLLSGPALQARCLQCPPSSLATPRLPHQGKLAALLDLLMP